jgi:hypothetical protein
VKEARAPYVHSTEQPPPPSRLGSRRVLGPDRVGTCFEGLQDPQGDRERNVAEQATRHCAIRSRRRWCASRPF